MENKNNNAMENKNQEFENPTTQPKEAKKGFFNKLKELVKEHPVASAFVGAGVAAGVGAVAYKANKSGYKKGYNQGCAVTTIVERTASTNPERLEETGKMIGVYADRHKACSDRIWEAWKDKTADKVW